MDQQHPELCTILNSWILTSEFGPSGSWHAAKIFEQQASRSCLTISKPKPRLAPDTRALHAFNAAMFIDENLVLSNNLPHYMAFNIGCRVNSTPHNALVFLVFVASSLNLSVLIALSNKTTWMLSKSCNVLFNCYCDLEQGIYSKVQKEHSL